MSATRSEVVAMLDSMLQTRMATAQATPHAPQNIQSWERENRSAATSGSFDEGGYTYTLGDGRSLVITENCTGLGNRLWDSCFMICKALEHSKASFNISPRRSVVELGAGCGLLGMLASHLGAAEVVCTDLSQVVPHLEDNLRSNNMPPSVTSSTLEWGLQEHLDSVVEGLAHPIGLVVAVDVCMRAFTVPLLLTTVRGLLEKSKAEEDPPLCLVASPTQREGWPVLLEQVKAVDSGLKLTPCPPNLYDPSYRSMKIACVFLQLDE